MSYIDEKDLTQKQTERLQRFKNRYIHGTEGYSSPAELRRWRRGKLHIETSTNGVPHAVIISGHEDVVTSLGSE